ncbi:MAG: VOC family protein [Alphaproteobacteria bacterium]|nr:VOC family protein [Alphaproteobacteria bacterium]
MARVTGIGGVFIKAKDPAALKQWYAENLGMKLEDWGGVVFHWADDQAVQSDSAATVWHLADANGDWFEGPVMINYRVDDLTALLAQLADAGIAPLKGPESHFNGLFAWVKDPEGNKFELWEPREPS